MKQQGPVKKAAADELAEIVHELSYDACPGKRFVGMPRQFIPGFTQFIRQLRQNKHELVLLGMPRSILLLLLLVFAVPALAQDPSKYLYTHLGSQDGLSSDFVMSVQEDSTGYIWIACNNSLQRYDGNRLRTFRYQPGSPNGLLPGNLLIIRLDYKGRLWILFDTFRAGYFDTEKLIFHEVLLNVEKESLVKASGTIYVTRNGKVFLLAESRFFLTFDETTGRFEQKANPFTLPQGFMPIVFYEDELQNIWIGCQQGLVKFNPANNRISYQQHNADNDPYIEKLGHLRTILHIYKDRKKRFWAAIWPNEGARLVSCDTSRKPIQYWETGIDKALNGVYFVVQNFLELHDGSFWISGHNLLARLNKNETQFIPVPNDQPGEFSIRFDDIHCKFEDREHNVWLGTNRGLFRFSPESQMIGAVYNRRFKDTTKYRLDVTDIFQLRNGNILAATWGEGVFPYDTEFNPLPNPIYTKARKEGLEVMTWCIIERSNGDIWRGEQSGEIVVLEKSSGKNIRIADSSFGRSTIRQMVIDQEGDIWIGTQSGRIILWNSQTGTFTLLYKGIGTVSKLICDRAGNIWCGTDSQGAYCFDGKTGKQLHHFTATGERGKSLRTNGISDLIQYNDSTFVFASDGLNILDLKTGRFTYLNTENGLPSNSISNLVGDKNGAIWMSTTVGIISFHPRSRKLSTYNFTDGVYTTSFNVSSSALLQDGRICFGTFHDILLFHPDSLVFSGYVPPRVTITGVELVNKAANTDSILNLPILYLEYNKNSLSIQYSTLTYQNVYPVFHTMEGLDKEWLGDNGSHSIVYSYLAPGRYTLKLACKDEKGNFGVITSLAIYIKAPFWGTWWFYSLLGLSLLGILFIFDRQRIRRIRTEQEMRATIAGNLHEEVNTVLQNINVLSEIARIKADTQPEQSKEYIYEIQQKSRNMVVAMNDMLWSIAPSNDSMPRSIERIHELAQAMESRYSVKVIVHTDNRVAALNLSMKARHEFILIYKLAITILVEELKAPETTVQLEYHKGKLHLQLYSRSIALPRFNNLVNRNLQEIRQRAALLNASVDIQSDEKGTWINLELKI